MARMPTKWEMQVIREKEEKKKQKLAEAKKAFIEEFVNKTPEEQAGIIFDLFNGLNVAITNHEHLENMRF